MDFMKVFDQTVREIKREVNKKVLKVPEIEQKVLDATSNEPWGPHGSLMAEIAQATRKFNESPLVMGVLWTRIADTGRNWRHVYKALTVLEYLVAHGSERIIDEIREHNYQISTLSDFQYVEPNGKDQGINVRKKAQTIVSLINDKEKIQEVRQKAAANRDKYCGLSSTGGFHKPSSYSGFGGGYDDDRRDDDGYGSRNTGSDKDWKSRDGDRYGRDGGDGYSRSGDRYKDDDFGRIRDHEDVRYNSKNEYDDNDYVSSRYSKKQSERKLEAPPSYQDSIDDPGSEEMGHGSVAATATKASSLGQSQVAKRSEKNVVTTSINDDDDFDDFNPRASSTSAAATVPTFTEDDLFGQPSMGGRTDVMKGIPPPPKAANAPITASISGPSSGIGLFADANLGSTDVMKGIPPPPKDANAPITAAVSGPNSGIDLFADANFNATFVAPSVSATNSLNQLPGDNFSQSQYNASFQSPEGLFAAQTSSTVSFTSSLTSGMNEGYGAFGAVSSNSNPLAGFGNADPFEGNLFSAFGTAVPPVQASQPPSMFQTQPLAPAVTQVSEKPNLHSAQAQNSSATGTAKSQSQKEKFQPKSSIWADTLSRGLIDLNITAPNSNSLANIGINLDSITMSERKEEEKKTFVSSMGKPMVSGSGLGRGGASTLAPSASPMMGTYGTGVGMGSYGAGVGIETVSGMGAGAGLGMPKGPEVGMPPRMGMPGMGMQPPMSIPGMGMQPPMGMPSGPGTGFAMNYTVGAGQGGFATQQQQFGGFS